MVGISLAMGFGINEPHIPVGMQLNSTPAFLGSLLTTAAMPAVMLVLSAVGGGNSALNATTMAGAWYLGSPQAEKMEIIIAAITVIRLNRSVDWRKLIGWFDAGGNWEV